MSFYLQYMEGAESSILLALYWCGLGVLSSIGMLINSIRNGLIDRLIKCCRSRHGSSHFHTVLGPTYRYSNLGSVWMSIAGLPTTTISTRVGSLVYDTTTHYIFTELSAQRRLRMWLLRFGRLWQKFDLRHFAGVLARLSVGLLFDWLFTCLTCILEPYA